jgi:hypothetical protein
MGGGDVSLSSSEGRVGGTGRDSMLGMLDLVELLHVALQGFLLVRVSLIGKSESE